MDFPRNVDRINMELPIWYFKGSHVEMSKLCLSVMKILFLSLQAVQNLIKCHILMRHFMWVFTVPNYLFGPVSRMKRVIV